MPDRSDDHADDKDASGVEQELRLIKAFLALTSRPARDALVVLAEQLGAAEERRP